MSKSVIDAELRITGTSNTGKVFDQMVKDAKRGTDALKKAADYDAIVARIKPLTTALDGAAKASAKTGGQLAQDATRISKEYGQLKGVLDLSAPLKAQLAQMRLNRAEIGALVKDAHRMTRERDQALSGIGNAKVRAQVMAADTNNIERQLRERARVMRMEADLTREIATRAARSQAHLSGRLYLDPADTRAFRERTTFSNRMERQRAALEKAEQADQRAADARAIMDGRRQIAFATRIAKQRQAEERALAAQELRAAREASRVAVAAEKAAAREASQAAKEAAQAKREAARERMQAAREAARSAREAARVEAAAIREGARETARVERDARRRERAQHGFEHRMGHLGRGVLVGAGVGYGVHEVGHLGRETIEKGSDYLREQTRGYLAGMDPKMQAEANEMANRYQSQFPSIGRVQILEHVRALRGTFGDHGDLHHTAAVLPDLLKAQVVLGTMRGNDRAAQDLDQLVKGLEGGGLAGDPAKFNRMLDAFLKASSLFGDTISGDGFRQYMQNAKSSKYGLNEEYLAGVVPTMMQHDGPQFGVMQRQAFSALIGDRQTKAATAKQKEFGLRDKRGKLVDQEQFVSDPYQWAVDHVLPQLTKRGINLQAVGKERGVIELTKLFSNPNAAEFFASLLMNQQVIDKDRLNLKTAKGREVAGEIREKDPFTSLEGVKQSVTRFAEDISSPLIKEAPQYMNAFTDALNHVSGWMEKHPQETKTGATIGGAVAAVTLPSIVGMSMKALAGQGTGVVANGLRIGGAGLSGIGSLALNPALWTLGMGAFATYATSQEYEKTFKERGPAGFDPATGSTVDGNPMAGLGPDHPWVREAIQGWWSKTMPTWAGGGEEAGKQIGETIGKAIVDAPLPPRRPAMLDDFKGKADETGSEAGKTLLQRIIESVGAGINIPINFVPGDGGGMGGGGSGIQKASFGGGGGSFAGLIQRASLGGGGSLGGGATFGGGSRGGGSGSGPTGPIPGIPASVEMTDAERNMLGLIQLHESHGRNTLNYVGTRQGLDPMTARGATAQGYFQILNSNWRRLAPGLGIKTRNAMSSTLEEQTRVALALLRASGGRPKDWAPFNPALRAAIARGDRAPDGGTMAERAAAAEPRLVKGLDGKEGLDLGNGTMKMPDGSIRSITSGMPRVPNVPDTPPAGARGAGEIGGHVAEFGRHVDRLQDMNFHGRVDVALSGGGGRVSGMRAKGRGMTADMGVTMPDLKFGSDDDWS
ncbi:hypothetical protein [Methylobacterium sp. 1973]|uniref:hypothetical protein n=1 Tax=Methylobacterium sp. 1973 TaxID=3156421 RepID=UPI0033928F3E